MDNSEAVERHKDDFARIDTNQDGLLDAIEIKEFYKSIEIYLNQEDMSAFFIASDKNEDGVIDEEEYVYTSLIYDEDGLNLEDYKFR